MEDVKKLLENDESLSLDIPSISSQESRSTFACSTSSTESTSEPLHSHGKESKSRSEKLEIVLNILNEHALAYYDSSISLQRKRDFLLLSMNLIRQNDLLKELPLADRQDIESYIQGISKRLNSVDISIGHSRKLEALNRIDELINTVICSGDITEAYNHCKQYLNAFEECSGLNDYGEKYNFGNRNHVVDHVDREFRALLLGCKKMDREIIKSRLESLMDHLNYQMCNELISSSDNN